jgi:hypothetical protein
MAREPLGGLGRLIFRDFTITHFRHTTLSRTPLDEGSALRRDLYLTTHNIHKRQTSMPPAGFEPAIPVSERPQTHALNRAATGIGIMSYLPLSISNSSWCLDIVGGNVYLIELTNTRSTNLHWRGSKLLPILLALQ